MLINLDFVPGLDSDLAMLDAANPPERALWGQVIDLLYDNTSAAERLCEAKGLWPHAPRFDCGGIVRANRAGLNLYRLKLFWRHGGPTAHRLLYAPHYRSAEECTIWLLGLPAREIDYDLQHPVFQRIAADYHRLGIPLLARG